MTTIDPLRAVAEPTRRSILRMVWSREWTAGDIAEQFPLSFGAISHHLGVLRQAGLVKVRVDGNRRWYRADPEGVAPLAPALEAMWSATLDDLANAVDSDDA